VRSFEQLAQDTSTSIPKAPADLLRVERPQRGLSREVAGLACPGHGGFWDTDAWHCPVSAPFL
jgi:hypothetical protein